ncbi:MAG: DEAD/DEAH box helicase [Deltaproteobacteria bacterium]|nr:DEAD/DEAH box helicase [Deltaproteobacteria bacterium]
MQFSDLALSAVIQRAVAAAGYTTPTPIQEQAIPHVLGGRDLVALAQTGTGKTAAFALPILERLHTQARPQKRPIRALVLSPTRELAAQIAEGFGAYGAGTGVTQAVIFGGVGEEPQRQLLRRGMDVLVATPGRLLAFMAERIVDFRELQVFVLDEADRMLDMGFIHDVKRVIAALPTKRQTLLFSATMPDDIEDLARRFMSSPVRVAVTPPATTVEKIAQSLFFVEHGHKRGLLLHLLGDPSVRRALLFTRTKHGANRVADVLERAGIAAAAIHGNKSQGARERALEGFRRGSVRVLVATDIAARGIDVDDVTHVIQLDLPEVPDQYVHRIGRTARAGAEGIAWAMCAPDERPLLKDIERTIRMRIDVVSEHPFVNAPAPAREPDTRGPRGARHGGRGRTAARHSPHKGGGARNESTRGTSPPGRATQPTAAPARTQTRTFRPGRR